MLYEFLYTYKTWGLNVPEAIFSLTPTSMSSELCLQIPQSAHLSIIVGVLFSIMTACSPSQTEEALSEEASCNLREYYVSVE